MENKNECVRAGVKRRLCEWAQTVNLRVTDSLGQDSQTMVVHPVILGRQSQFFACLSDSESELDLTIPGPMTLFSQFIGYLYSGTLVEPLEAESSVFLFYLAYKYNVDRLATVCRTWWEQHCFPASKAESFINDNLLSFLKEIHRHPLILSVFQHVLSSGKGSILDSAYLQLAKQVWAGLSARYQCEGI